MTPFATSGRESRSFTIGLTMSSVTSLPDAMARLRAEKAYYQLASGLIKLAPGQTQELVDLQELVRLHLGVLGDVERHVHVHFGPLSGAGAPAQR